MDNAGHTAAAAGIDVYDRPGNRAGTNDETKASRYGVGNPLTENFSVAVMLGAGHFIYNQSCQQRFDGPQ